MARAARPSGRRRLQRIPALSVTPDIGLDMIQAATRSGELAHASAYTISRRVGMMMQAAGDPSAMSDPEFTRMVTEKVEAFSAAGGAVMGGVQTFWGVWTAAAVGQMLGVAQACTALAACRTPEEVAQVQRRWIDASRKEATATLERLAGATVALFSAGLAPIHAAASANARRLGR
jgi:hypothetical protein